MKISTTVLAALALTSGDLYAQEMPTDPMMPAPTAEMLSEMSGIETAAAEALQDPGVVAVPTAGMGTQQTTDRVTYRVLKHQRGSTVTIPTTVISSLCGDLDGCTLRLGMHNWDNTGRVASRESLFYFNRINRAWRASYEDRWGTDFDGRTQHVMNAWSCYVTDGRYSGWHDRGDSQVNFGLLSWSQYVADCWVTIVD